MIGDQNADAFVFKGAHHALEIGDGNGIDAGEGLVEEEDLGFGDEGAGDFGAAAFPAERV